MNKYPDQIPYRDDPDFIALIKEYEEKEQKEKKSK